MRNARDLIRRGLVVCALCKGSLKYHNCYPRHILDELSSRYSGWIAQMHCVACGVYPALIPDFIMPHKHYEAGVIEKVIAQSERGSNIEKFGDCSADISTMRRWIRQFKERGARAVGWLLSILLALHERQISLLKLQGKSLLKQLARLLCELRIPDDKNIIGKVNIILTTQNCGFL
jgi:hypothetical protein